MQIKGEIIGILPETKFFTKDNKEVRKKMFLIQQTGTRHPNKLGISIFNELIEKYPIEVGKCYTVLFDSDARLSDKEDRYYNDLKAWKIEDEKAITNSQAG